MGPIVHWLGRWWLGWAGGCWRGCVPGARARGVGRLAVATAGAAGCARPTAAPAPQRRAVALARRAAPALRLAPGAARLVRPGPRSGGSAPGRCSQSCAGAQAHQRLKDALRSAGPGAVLAQAAAKKPTSVNWRTCAALSGSWCGSRAAPGRCVAHVFMRVPVPLPILGASGALGQLGATAGGARSGRCHAGLEKLRQRLGALGDFVKTAVLTAVAQHQLQRLQRLLKSTLSIKHSLMDTECGRALAPARWPRRHRR